MKRLAMAALAVSWTLASTQAWAEGATRDECIAKTKQAVRLIDEKGVDVAIAQIGDKAGAYVWKDSYVFLMDLDGKMLAHPVSPALVGKNLIDVSDKGTPGKPVFKEFVQLARSKGEGWIEYQWPKPGSTAAVKKTSYICRVPGKDLLVGAGTYE